MTPAAVAPAAVKPMLVDEVVAPAPCREPKSGTVVATARGTSLSASTSDAPVAAGEEATTPAPVSVAENSTPAAPAAPPTPVRLPTPIPTPAPAGPAGPSGSSAAAASGTVAYGGGQNLHADSIDAVLDAQVAASLAQAALRHASGFAGAVCGDTDRPGARPG
jgi:hypothetical protein